MRFWITTALAYALFFVGFLLIENYLYPRPVESAYSATPDAVQSMIDADAAMMRQAFVNAVFKEIRQRGDNE